VTRGCLGARISRKGFSDTRQESWGSLRPLRLKAFAHVLCSPSLGSLFSLRFKVFFADFAISLRPLRLKALRNLRYSRTRGPETNRFPGMM
jgi:hypothetical protein